MTVVRNLFKLKPPYVEKLGAKSFDEEQDAPIAKLVDFFIRSSDWIYYMLFFNHNKTLNIRNVYNVTANSQDYKGLDVSFIEKLCIKHNFSPHYCVTTYVACKNIWMFFTPTDTKIYNRLRISIDYQWIMIGGVIFCFVLNKQL